MQLDQEFYDRIVALTDHNSTNEPPLEQYLQSLLGILHRAAERTSFDADEFFNMLEEAYEAPPQDFDPEWSKIEDVTAPAVSYEDVAKVLKRQIAQLWSFRPEQLATAQIYLDNGECWNNFVVSAYLESAVAGAQDNFHLRGEPGNARTISWDDIRFFLGLGQAYE